MKFYKILIIIVALTIFKDLLDVGILAIFSNDRNSGIFNLLLYHGNLFAKLLLYVPLIAYVSRKYKLNIYTDFKFGNLKITSLLIALAILTYFIIVPFVNLETYSRLIKTGNISFYWFDLYALKDRDVITFLSVVIIGPIIEEIIFRGIVLKLFVRKYSTINAIILSSIIFSICHLKPLGMIYLFVYGLLFGYAYIKTNSLTMSILCHVLINFLAQINSYPAVNPETIFYVFIGVGIGLFMIKLILSELNKDDKLFAFQLKGIKSGWKTLVKDMIN